MGEIDFGTSPGVKEHVYEIRLRYNAVPRQSEESLSTQARNHAGSRDADPQTSLSTSLDSLSTEEGANPDPEPDSDSQKSQGVRAPIDVLEKTTTLPEDQVLGEGSPTAVVHYEEDVDLLIALARQSDPGARPGQPCPRCPRTSEIKSRRRVHAARRASRDPLPAACG